MTQPQAKNRPSHEAYVVEGEGKSASWTKIGAAWPHENGTGLTIRLSAVPLSGRLVLRAPKPKAEADAEVGA